MGCQQSRAAAAVPPKSGASDKEAKSEATTSASQLEQQSKIEVADAPSPVPPEAAPESEPLLGSAKDPGVQDGGQQTGDSEAWGRSEAEPKRSLVGEDVDMFAAFGVQMPAHLRTHRLRWLSLFAVIVTSSLASGPMASWPTLEPLLIAEGVWEGEGQGEKLSSVYSIAIGMAMLSGSITGVLFDTLGPRVLMVCGASGVVFSQIMLALAVQYQSLNDLIWVFYPTATFCGWANTTGVYTWLFLLPEDSSRVSSLIGAVQVLSDSLVIVAVWLNSQYGLTLPWFFLVVAGTAAFAGVVAFLMVPTLEDHTLYTTISGKMAAEAQVAEAAEAASAAEAVEAGEIDGCEAPAEPELEAVDSTCWGKIKQSWASMKDTAAVFMIVHPGACWLSTLYFLCQYMWLIFPMIEMYGWYGAMFDKEQTEELLNLWGVIYGIVGSVALVAVGSMVDKVGLVSGMNWLNIPLVICTAMMCVPDFTVQVAAQFFLAVLTNVVWAVLLPRFALHYFPSSIFGTFNGLLMTILGVSQMVLTPISETICRLIQDCWESAGLPELGDAGRFTVAFCFWTAATEVFFLLYLLHLRKRPLPPPGSLSISEIRRAVAAKCG